MSSSVVLTCLFALQQLQVGPVPAAVGQEIVVRATKLREPGPKPGTMPSAQGPAGGIEITLEHPDQPSRVLGVTGPEGMLRFAADVVGPMAVSANINGVRCVASIAIGPARDRWLLGLVCVPLGLAVLWLQMRRLLAGRRIASQSRAN